MAQGTMLGGWRGIYLEPLVQLLQSTIWTRSSSLVLERCRMMMVRQTPCTSCTAPAIDRWEALVIFSARKQVEQKPTL
jgi:hypothetical protein